MRKPFRPKPNSPPKGIRVRRTPSDIVASERPVHQVNRSLLLVGLTGYEIRCYHIGVVGARFPFAVADGLAGVNGQDSYECGGSEDGQTLWGRAGLEGEQEGGGEKVGGWRDEQHPISPGKGVINPGMADEGYAPQIGGKLGKDF